MAKNFADRLAERIPKTSHCIVGIDPRIEDIPEVFFQKNEDSFDDEIIEEGLFDWGKTCMDAIYDLVPLVKFQSAFYEQYGIAGLSALIRSVEYAKEQGLMVIMDAKRNDIGSTAEAYARTFLGQTNMLGNMQSVYDADALTVSPYLGRDSLVPFVEACKEHGKGLFVLVKTSNPGSSDLQDRHLSDEAIPLYQKVANMVDELGLSVVGKSGYSSIGAVVGATQPAQAEMIRGLMPHAFFLVPGYGAQGGTASDVLPSFNPDKTGALVSASRSITFGCEPGLSKKDYSSFVRKNTEAMVKDIEEALKNNPLQN